MFRCNHYFKETNDGSVPYVYPHFHIFSLPLIFKKQFRTILIIVIVARLRKGCDKTEKNEKRKEYDQRDRRFRKRKGKGVCCA